MRKAIKKPTRKPRAVPQATKPKRKDKPMVTKYGRPTDFKRARPKPAPPKPDFDPKEEKFVPVEFAGNFYCIREGEVLKKKEGGYFKIDNPDTIEGVKSVAKAGPGGKLAEPGEK